MTVLISGGEPALADWPDSDRSEGVLIAEQPPPRLDAGLIGQEGRAHRLAVAKFVSSRSSSRLATQRRSSAAAAKIHSRCTSPIPLLPKICAAVNAAGGLA
jgi:hypothetical protein